MLINITITLFILSLISERITNFFKLRFYDKSKDVYKKLSEKEETEKKEKDNLDFALAFGIFTALFLKISLFDLFTEDFQKHFGWSLKDFNSKHLECLPKTIIGCIFTGIFLSFGSKFWHDLLDLLFQIKNLRRKLVDEKTYQVQNLKELDEYLDISDYDLANLAIEQNETLLKSKYPNIVSIQVGYADKSEKAVVSIDTSDNEGINLPKKLNATLPSGRIIEVETDIIYNVDIPEALSLLRGDRINIPTNGSTGTLGCILKSNFTDKHFLLTCSHVITGNSYNFGGRVEQDKKVEVRDTTGSIIGKLYYALRDKENDFALVELFNPKETPTPSEAREVVYNDFRYKTPIKFKGATSNEEEGFIINYKCKVPIKYKDKIVKLHNLIKLSKQAYINHKTMSNPADSGAVVFDRNNKAIGIVVAGNKQFTYALPMDKILEISGASII